MKPCCRLSLLALALVCSALPATHAQAPTSGPAANPAATATVAPQNLRAQALSNFSETSDKLVRLAEAMPAEKYAWRPGEGVRSVGEVFMHLAGANLLFARLLGAPMPAGMRPDLEKMVTEKAAVVDWLQKSSEQVKQTLGNLSDEDLKKPAKLFGRDTNYQGVILALVSHNHEHLGQAIVYARINGVVPPWTGEQQQRLRQRQRQQPPQ